MALAIAKKESAFGATLLITGCCIGAGMLGLPVVSALAGFIPSSIAMLICYAFTTATGLLLLEATLWFDQKVNLLSITHFALGKVGRMMTWTLYLLLFYCLFVAYMDGGGQIFSSFLTSLLNTPVSREVGIFSCTALIAALSYAGTKILDKINRALMVGLVACFGLLIYLGLPHVDPTNLLNSQWIAAAGTLPILFICFGYQNLVPSLAHYLKRNVNAMRIAILIGNFIPFLIYFLWNYTILGMIQSPHQLLAHEPSDMVVGLLQSAAPLSSVMVNVKVFSLFLILTSFLPNTMTFMDFLKDGLKLPRLGRKTYDLLILGLVLVPPLLFSLAYPNLFLQALGFAGGFIDVLLFGILPVAIVWIGRYRKQIEGPYRFPGGKLALVCIALFSLGCLLLKI